MKIAKKLKRVIRQIVVTANPEKILLFGSHACGRPTQNSDVDLLVIMKTRKRFIDHEIEISKSLRFYPFPMDILVRNSATIRRRIKMNDPFYEEIMTKGKILYES